MFYSKFKLGKLNHIAIATRDAKSHLNFFGNVLKAEIGDKQVKFQANNKSFHFFFLLAATRTRRLHHFCQLSKRQN